MVDFKDKIGPILKRKIIEAHTPWTLLNHPWEFEHHYTPTADFLLYSQTLGVIGLVWILEQEKLDAVASHIYHANYLRHLFLKQNSAEIEKGNEVKDRPWQVEVVLVVKNRDLIKVGDQLNKLSREISNLSTIGIGVLPVHLADGQNGIKKDSGFDKAFRRAFPWLLTHTRKWLEKNPMAKQTQKLATIKLENYRLPGTRTIHFDQKSNIHLIYGKNGSGKSSIAEAFEFFIKKRPARLSSLPQIKHVLIPDHTDLEPGLSINGIDHVWDPQVTGNQANQNHFPQKPEASASFLLNQEFMNQLSTKGDAHRAELFLSAWFPESSETIKQVRTERIKVEKAFKELPDRLIGTIPKDSWRDAITTLSWLNTGTPPIDLFLPISQQSLDTLAKFGYLEKKDLEKTRDSDKSQKSFNLWLNEINKKVNILRDSSKSLLKNINTSRKALEGLSSWQLNPGQKSGMPWSELLNNYAETLALSQMAENQFKFLKTLDDLSTTNQPVKPVLSKWQKQFTDLKGSTREANELRKELARKWNELAGQLGVKESGEDIAENPFSRNLDRDEITALNQLGPVLGQNDLGTLLDSAIREGKDPGLLKINLSKAGWAEELSKSLATLESAINEVELSTDTSDWPENLNQFKKMANEVFKLEQEIQKEFIDVLAKDDILNNAINELMALFTPARWAYEDIRLEYNPENKDFLHLGMGGRKHGDLKLNTAELNLFTLTLFLLCAPKQPNQFGLLVLDDPLQNMDELTVTTLARGFALLSQTLMKNLTLLLLLHGLDNFERFRSEVPLAVYMLPWLRPIGSIPSLENGTGSGEDQGTTEPLEIKAEEHYWQGSGPDIPPLENYLTTPDLTNKNTDKAEPQAETPITT